MIHPKEHEALEARLAQQVKFNPALAARLEESNGFVADVRDEGEPLIREQD